MSNISITQRGLRDEPPQTQGLKQGLNVGEGERLVSMLGGGGLVLWGAARGSWSGLALAALGGALIYRGVSGHCPCYEALGINTAQPPDRREDFQRAREREHEPRVDVVQEASEESFPASDAPAW